MKQNAKENFREQEMIGKEIAKKFAKESWPGREQKEGEEVLNNAVKLSGTGLSERRRNN